MTEKSLKKHNVMIALVVKVSESLAQSMSADVLLDSTSLGCFLEHLTQSIHFDMSTFTRGEDVLIRVKTDSIAIIPLNGPYTRVIEIETAAFIHLLLEDRNPVGSISIIASNVPDGTIREEDIRALEFQQLISS